jgi:hypothetical protein
MRLCIQVALFALSADLSAKGFCPQKYNTLHFHSIVPEIITIAHQLL